MKQATLFNEIPPKKILLLWGSVMAVVFFLMLDMLILSPHAQNRLLKSRIHDKKMELESLQKGVLPAPDSGQAPLKSTNPRRKELLKRAQQAFLSSHLSSEKVVSELLARLSEPQENRASLEVFNVVVAQHFSCLGRFSE